jgi:hypothetical protein
MSAMHNETRNDAKRVAVAYPGSCSFTAFTAGALQSILRAEAQGTFWPFSSCSH